MPIPRENPAVVPSVTYDEWFLTRFEVYPDPVGPWRASIEFVPGRNTGTPILWGGQPALGGDGTARTAYDVLRDDARRVEIADLNELAREQATAGDTRLLQALGLVLTLAAEHAKATGAID